MKFKILAGWMLLLGSLAWGAAWEQSASFHNVNASIRSEKALLVGNNTLLLTLNQQNIPIDHAVVEVKAFMPSMDGMESKVIAAFQGHGAYKATVNLEMRGMWQLHIYVMTKEGKKYHLKTSLSF